MRAQWDTCVYCVAGAVVQGLLCVHDAAVARHVGMYALGYVAMVAASFCPCVWAALRFGQNTPVERFVAFAFMLKGAACFWVHLAVVRCTVQCLWTNCPWTAAVVCFAPAAVTQFWAPEWRLVWRMMCVEGWYTVRLTDVFLAVGCKAMWHVDRLCFPAALAMTAMGHWADEVLTRAEKDAWLDFFHAAQTGDLPALQPMVRRLPARKWRHVCSAGAAHVASVRLKRAVAVAAANGRTECVRLLLGADAALVAESAGRLRPAFLAIKSDSVQCLELLLAAKASTGGRGKSPPLLLAAVMHGASACIVATLLAARAPVYARHVLTDPLAEAAKCQTPEVVQLLLGAKACVHGRDTPFGWHGIHGPIRAAAANVTDHRLAVLQLLLDAKASVNADAGDGTGQGQAEGQGQGPGQGTYFPLDFAATADAAALLRAHGARTARLARPAHSTRPARDSK